VSQFLLEKFGFNALQKIHKGRHGKNKKRDTMGRFGSDNAFLCKASPVPRLVLLHEHLAEVIAKYQCSLKQESKANDAEFFIAT
jgi:hypothetical protein